MRYGRGFYIDVEPSAAHGLGSVAVLSVLRSDMNLVEENLFSWSAMRDLSFMIAGCEDSTTADGAKLLQQMVLAKAFPFDSLGSTCRTRSVDPQDPAALEAARSFEQHGVIQRVGEHQYVFTEHGLQRLRHMHRCTLPTRFFQSIQDLDELELEDLKQCTTWELLTLLKHRHWQLRQAPQPKALKTRPLPPVTAAALDAGERVWYSRTISLQSQTSYMIALLQSEEQIQAGSWQMLHHCQPKRYYDAVLNGSSDGVVLALQDVEAMPQPMLRLDVEADVLAVSEAQVPAIAPGPNATHLSQHVLAALQAEGDLENYDAVHTSNSEDLDFALPSASEESSAHDMHEDVPPDPSLHPEPNPRASDSPPIPPLDDSEAPAQAHVGGEIVRAVHPDSFAFGPHFRLTFVTPDKRPPHGCWQGTCRYHRLNQKTRCTRALNLGPSQESKELCMRAMMSWCLPGSCKAEGADQRREARQERKPGNIGYKIGLCLWAAWP